MKQSEIEKKILEFWRQDETFRKSVNRPPSQGQGKDFVFYDGPPFATGTPHYGHIVASLMKDMVPRYWTMRGWRVERRWGWDCHGLPIENIVEKEHGFKHKKDILVYGVDKFNEDARSKVLMYAKEWREVIERLGRWVDMDNDYKTMDLKFMENVWGVFKQLSDKGLLYEAYRSMHICPRCETTLAQSEVAQGYKDVVDLSLTAKFELTDEPGTFLLAWTTTPWTLPGNVALAVGANILYSIVEMNNEYYILATERLATIFKDKEYKSIKEFKGKDLIDKKYKPLFPYYDNDKLSNYENAFKVYAADFVNTEDGTGIVHIAPAFGEDDMNLGKEKNLPFIQHVNMDGTFKKEVTDFAGELVKHQDAPATEDHPETKVESADVKIIKYLAAKNLLFSKAKYTHSYPHCWRCDSPLLNYAASSWFVNVIKIKEKMLKQAKNINWMPEHIKDGRFGNWLEGSRDWSISRQRFWGSVLPVWKSDDNKEMKVIGSIDELRSECDAKITKIIFSRHGESEKNITHIHSSALEKYPLTKVGEKQAQELSKQLKDQKIDVIICSPILRTRQTAEKVVKSFDLKIEFDNRLLEDNNGIWEEKNQEELNNDELYKKYLALSLEKRIAHKMGGAESEIEVVERVRDFINDVAKKYPGQTVLVVSHGIVSAAFDYILNKCSLEKFYYLCDYTPFATPFNYYVNEDGTGFDLHKHYVDKIILRGKNNSVLHRIPDVLDCWFESGSMPYTQAHFPAQFIAEGVDQTRAWFYYLHVLATALKEKPAFSNVVVNGIVLAEDGQKMSKRLKNYPDPMEMFEKYGADAVRYYLATAPVLRAEDLNFSEKGVEEVVKKVILILYNVLAFYKMYETRHPEPVEGHNNSDTEYPSTPFRSTQDDDSHVLDQWIMAKTNQLISDVTAAYDKYDLNRATRPIAEFVNELSTWYLRRSRDRFKGDDEKDKINALATLKYVLENLCKILAPVMPFTAEYIWQELGYVESVHLESWPKTNKIDEKVLEEMDLVRKIVELGLAERAKLSIKIRQPLQSVVVKGEKLDKNYINLIKDELNIKEVEFKKGESLTLELNTEISKELQLEGHLRELVRTINGMRKNIDLTPGDVITLCYQTDSKELQEVFVKFESELKKSVIAKEIVQGESGEEISLNGEKVKISIQK